MWLSRINIFGTYYRNTTGWAILPDYRIINSEASRVISGIVINPNPADRHTYLKKSFLTKPPHFKTELYILVIDGLSPTRSANSTKHD